MKNCSQCQEPINKKARRCPHCRSKQPRSSIWLLLVGSTFVIMYFGVCVPASSIMSNLPKKVETPESIRFDQIRSGFSSWDSSHRGLTKLVKRTMRDPNSFEHESTTFIDKGDHLIVQMRFRAANGFGGMNKIFVKAKTDLDGNVLEIIEQIGN